MRYLYLLFLVFLSFNLVLGLTCTIRNGGCLVGEACIASISDTLNAHITECGYFDYNVCCSPAEGETTIGNCENPLFYEKFHFFNNSDPQLNKICFTGKGFFECTLNQTVPENYTCVFSTSDVNNAHVAQCNYYPYQFSCKYYPGFTILYIDVPRYIDIQKSDFSLNVWVYGVPDISKIKFVNLKVYDNYNNLIYNENLTNYTIQYKDGEQYFVYYWRGDYYDCGIDYKIVVYGEDIDGINDTKTNYTQLDTIYLEADYPRDVIYYQTNNLNLKISYCSDKLPSNANLNVTLGDNLYYGPVNVNGEHNFEFSLTEPQNLFIKVWDGNYSTQLTDTITPHYSFLTIKESQISLLMGQEYYRAIQFTLTNPSDLTQTYILRVGEKNNDLPVKFTTNGEMELNITLPPKTNYTDYITVIASKTGNFQIYLDYQNKNVNQDYGEILIPLSIYITVNTPLGKKLIASEAWSSLLILSTLLYIITKN